MRVGRRDFLGALAAGAILGCAAREPAVSAPARPAAPAGPTVPAPEASDRRAGPAKAPRPITSASLTGGPPAGGGAPASGGEPAADVSPGPGGDALERAIDLVLRQQRGSFGVAVRDLAGSVSVEVRARERFALASLYKVLLMYEVARLVDAGRLRLDEAIKTAPEYSFGEPEGGVPPDTRLTVDEALAATIGVSSNGAALALIDRVTPAALRAAPGRLGLGDTTVDPRPTGEPGHYWVEAFGSARDLAELFGRLGRGQLVSPALDRRMVGYLLGQRIKDRLPRRLPDGTPVGHKTGEVDGLTHDGGLVLLPSRPYAIVVLAEGESPTEGRAIVAELSRVAYAHFSGAG
jgi:beta-lactamase class A